MIYYYYHYIMDYSVTYKFFISIGIINFECLLFCIIFIFIQIIINYKNCDNTQYIIIITFVLNFNIFRRLKVKYSQYFLKQSGNTEKKLNIEILKNGIFYAKPVNWQNQFCFWPYSKINYCRYLNIYTRVFCTL